MPRHRCAHFTLAKLLVGTILSILAALLLPAWRRTSPWAFLVPCAIGVILSYPFIIQTTGLRFNSVTYPFQAALPAAAIAIQGPRGRAAGDACWCGI